MPPNHDDDGARLAGHLRSDYPQLDILLLSQHIETRHSVDRVSLRGRVSRHHLGGSSMSPGGRQATRGLSRLLY